MEHEGGIELAAVHRARRVLEIAGEVERKDVDCEYTRPPCPKRGERLLMGIVAVSCKNNEGVYAALLPGAEQIVHPAVQRLAADGGVAGIGAFDSRVDAVGYRRRA